MRKQDRGPSSSVVKEADLARREPGIKLRVDSAVNLCNVLYVQVECVETTLCI